MFKKMFVLGVLLVIALATVLVTPNVGQAQRYFGGGYGMYRSYYQPYYNNYGPYYGYQSYYAPSYVYPYYSRPYYGGYYQSGYPGYYGAYPRYGYYPNQRVWR
jgi:hypothetical protein